MDKLMVKSEKSLSGCESGVKINNPFDVTDMARMTRPSFGHSLDNPHLPNLTLIFKGSDIDFSGGDFHQTHFRMIDKRRTGVLKTPERRMLHGHE